MKNKILVVDDEAHICDLFHKVLSKEGHEVSIASNGKKALEITKKERPNLVLLDLKLPDIDGIEVLRQLKKIRKDIMVIMITAYGTVKTAREAMKLGAYDYISKPFTLTKVENLIKKALEMQALTKEVATLRSKVKKKHQSK